MSHQDPGSTKHKIYRHWDFSSRSTTYFQMPNQNTSLNVLQENVHLIKEQGELLKSNILQFVLDRLDSFKTMIDDEDRLWGHNDLVVDFCRCLYKDEDIDQIWISISISSESSIDDLSIALHFVINNPFKQTDLEVICLSAEGTAASITTLVQRSLRDWSQLHLLVFAEGKGWI